MRRRPAPLPLRAPVVLVVFLVAATMAQAAPPARTITLTVDATEAARRIWHARMTVPVGRGGTLTLHYPRWLPGAHGPVIPVVNLAGLVARARGAPLPWRRDDLDLHAFRVEVPGGASEIEVEYDYLAVAPDGAGGRGAALSGERVAMIDWAYVVLYPDGDAGALRYAPRLRLPAGWRHATALELDEHGGAPGEIAFAPVSLERLVDSPVLAGAVLRRFDLGRAAGAPHELAVAGAAEADLRVPDELLAAWRRLTEEALALFGARHYRAYHFLLALVGDGRASGLEHHESSDNRGPARLLADEALRWRAAGLLPHELVHSWNGKFRRPAGLVRPDYQRPVEGELLWVYEGLTSYYGQVLAARAGLRTAAQAREELALIASDMALRAGRAWRPLQDTAIAATVGGNTPDEWASWRRGHDYYGEGALLWLEVDALLRRDSGGRRSLDEVARAFFGRAGGGDGGPEVEAYRLDDLLAALTAAGARDWRRQLRQRLDAVGGPAPLGGLEASGWRLVYTAEANEAQRAADTAAHQIQLRASLGLSLREDGTVLDVIPGLAAARAGAGPGMKVRAVGGRRFTPEVLRDALFRTASDDGGVELLVESDDWFRALRLDYRGGPRHPHLERIAGTPDLLAAILAPRTRGLSE